MTRATGGSAAAATSTRSSPFEYAYSRASSVVLIPICSPSSPTRRTWGTRMFSLIRSCGCGTRRSSGRRLGLKGSSPSSWNPPHRRRKPLQAAAHIFLVQPARLNPHELGTRKVRGSGPLLLSGPDRSNCRLKTFEQFRKARRELVAAALPDRERLVRLAIAVDDGVGDLLQLRVADPLAERLVALVDVDAEPRGVQPAAELVDGLAVALTDRDHTKLDGREPEGERARVVLGQDADEALERAEEGAVDDEDRVLVVVRSHVGEAEPRRHLSVELDRPQLPRPPEHVRHVQVDLRAVERSLALTDEVLDLVPFERAHEFVLGEVPLVVCAELVVRARGELGTGFEPEQAVQVPEVVEGAVELALDLLARAEDVGVVLGHVPDAGQPVQRAG